MKYITKEVRIGIAGIIALCVLIYGINWLKGIHMFQPSSYFYAKFQNVNGLTKSSPVFADGVRVGIVRDIYYDYVNPGNVIVEVELDTELRIPKGSSAELVSELMGGVRMNILLANNPREKYAVGDTIPGKLNNGMMESVAQLMPKVQEMLPKLDSILISLNNILGDKSIPATLHSMETTTANLAVVSSQMKGLMSKDIQIQRNVFYLHSRIRFGTFRQIQIIGNKPIILPRIIGSRTVNSKSAAFYTAQVPHASHSR